ncbi:c-type cytochrome [Mucilaginibacter sp. E4BP6]|uniref:c-type cytochrome n=1 Tax=Mucilaginibacter sp. E4BP6 TaxID=2723089 RepID=UPI0015C903D0|nr:c-type cytochrome [Mucilaginibacter sp. E4BP6]NYE64765.1 cytochrome c553 [Mucilaginibacter sp. E4BP6]
MKIKRSFTIITVLAAAVTIIVLASFNEPEPPLYTNLKVLPKNISSKDLQSIMADDFEDGIGVSCGFCHANNKDGHGLDFASDAKPEKEIARSMMRMTLNINEKYLKLKHPKIGDAALIISCTTCHKGQPFPDGADPK